MTKTRNIIAWTFQILMGVLYLLASSGKVISDPEVIHQFELWGYPYGFYLIIGFIELICGVLLFYPKTAGYATIMLFAVMVGAVITHVVHQEGLIVLKPIGYSAGLWIVFYYRFIYDIKNDDVEQFPLQLS